MTPLSLLAEGQISDALELALETKNMGMHMFVCICTGLYKHSICIHISYFIYNIVYIYALNLL